MDFKYARNRVLGAVYLDGYTPAVSKLADVLEDLVTEVEEMREQLDRILMDAPAHRKETGR